MQTVGALEHVSYDEPGIYSYEQALPLVRALGLGTPAAEQQFRRMVFNVVARNQDDHAPAAAARASRPAGSGAQAATVSPTGGEVAREVLCLCWRSRWRGWGQSNLHLQRRPHGRQKEHHNMKHATFADLGVSEVVVNELAQRGHRRAVRRPGDGHPRRAGRPRRAGPVADRVGQDARVRRAAGRAAEATPTRARRRSCWRPTRELAIQIVDELRPIATPARCRSPRLRRRRDRQAGAARGARAHPRRDARDGCST